MTEPKFDPRGFPGYLFDLDGTLIDTAPDIRAAVNHSLNRFGFASVSEDLVRHWVGHGGRACIEHAVARALSENEPSQENGPNGPSKGNAPNRPSQGDVPDEPSQFLREGLIDDMLNCFLEHYGAHIADASLPYPATRETLAALRNQGAKLAVVTNKRIELTRKLLDALDLTPAFDVIVGGDTAPNPKPAPDPIHFACKATSLTPADILFVGDSQTDVHAARAAGCPVVCVPYGYNHGIAPERLGADAVIGSLKELVFENRAALRNPGN